MNLKNIFNFALFQIAWFVTLFAAAYGKPYVGVLFTVIWMTLHFIYFSHSKNVELLLIIITIIFSYLVESSLVIAGFISYPAQAVFGSPAPIWMVTLWINLALTINYSMSWLKGRYILSALLAAIAGPLAYVAGEKIGAIVLNEMPALIAISIMWLIAMPLLFWLVASLSEFKLFKDEILSEQKKS